MKHKHHIIPKHEGGIDQPENIIYLSIEEHAEAHRLLYEKNGKIEDYLAWKGLAGIMSKEEIVQKLMSENGKAVGNKMFQDKKGEIPRYNPAREELGALIHDPVFKGWWESCKEKYKAHIHAKKIGLL